MDFLSRAAGKVALPLPPQKCEGKAWIACRDGRWVSGRTNRAKDQGWRKLCHL